MIMLAPVLTPHGLLTLRQADDALALEADRGERLERAFIRGSGHGLLCLGADEVGTTLPPVLSYWREFGARYVAALCALPDIAEASSKPPVPIPDTDTLHQIAAAVPPMTGAEYLTADVLADLWRDMDTAFDVELAEAKLSVQEFSRAVTRPGTSSGVCTSILPRTEGMRRLRLRFLRPTRHGFRPRPRLSICRSARLCRNTLAPGTAIACYPC